ncbi:MAG: hypothetical protein LUQ66_03495 [Methanoregula sp.]|nr:hypothetical protein [Methanoregula sp.]
MNTILSLNRGPENEYQGTGKGERRYSGPSVQDLKNRGILQGIDDFTVRLGRNKNVPCNRKRKLPVGDLLGILWTYSYKFCFLLNF